MLGLIGFTPLISDKTDSPKAHDHILCVVRRIGFCYIAFFAIGLMALFYIGGLSYLSGNPDSQAKFNDKTSTIVFLCLSACLCSFLIAKITSFIFHRTVKTQWSSLERRFRYNVSGDKESDIRDVVGKLKTKQYLPSKYYREDSDIFIGLNAQDKAQYIDVAQFEETHTEIIGPTRTGKGVVMGVIAEQEIKRGNMFIFHDPKGDKFLPHIMKEAAEKNGAKFVYFDLNETGIGTWSPFEAGTKREQRSRLMWALGMKETGSDADFYKLGEKSIIDLLLSGDAWTSEHLLKTIKERKGDQFREAENLLSKLESLTICEPSGKQIMKALQKHKGAEGACNDLKAIFDKPGGKVGWGTRMKFWRWVQQLSGNGNIQTVLKEMTIFVKSGEQLTINEICDRLNSRESEDAKRLAVVLNEIKTNLKTDGWSINKLLGVLRQEAEDKQAKRAISALNEMAQVSTFTPPEGKGTNWESLISSDQQHVVYIKGSLTDDLIRKMHRLLLIHLGELIIRLEKEGKRTRHVTQMVDEVSFLTSMELANDLATIGGYRCNMVLAYQDPSQLRNIADQTIDAGVVESSIHTNCQNKIIYRMAEDEMAEWAAGMTGKQFKTVKRMEKTRVDHIGSEVWDDQASYNKVEEAYITENVFKGLPQMIGVLITPGRLSSIVFTCFVPTEQKTDFLSPAYSSENQGPQTSPPPLVAEKEDAGSTQENKVLPTGRSAQRNETSNGEDETCTDSPKHATEVQPTRSEDDIVSDKEITPSSSDVTPTEQNTSLDHTEPPEKEESNEWGFGDQGFSDDWNNSNEDEEWGDVDVVTNPFGKE